MQGLMTTVHRCGMLVVGILGITCNLDANDRLARIPDTFHEISAALSLVNETRPADDEQPAKPSLWREAYDTRGVCSWTTSLPAITPSPERLDLWVEGDGTGNSLRFDVYHKPRGAWLEQARVPLDSSGWRHLVIPAGNPIHAFHPEVTMLRWRVVPEKHATGTTGQLALRDATLVRTAAVPGSLPSVRPPAPVFDTWGGPGQKQLANVATSGVNLHLIPVDFPIGQKPARRAAYAAKAIPWAKKAGIMVGLAFYPTPPAAWLDTHKDLLCRSAGAYYDRPGGAFLSPWNPRANEILTIHIKEVLTFLKDEGLLNEIDVIELCPGEEGEVSFEWNHVWAFDEHAVAAYREFLARQYRHAIAALNRDWATHHESFAAITPPVDHYPDREHWVFTEFYRGSMLRRCALMADAASTVFEPTYWLWMPHSIGNARQRFFSARYPEYYTTNLRRLGCADFVHIAALDWQTVEDVRQMQQTGVRALAEIDIEPTPDRLAWTFQQAQSFGCDGVFVGVVRDLVDKATGDLTKQGELTRSLTEDYRQYLQKRELLATP